jgi:hypothetical protein
MELQVNGSTAMRFRCGLTRMTYGSKQVAGLIRVYPRKSVAEDLLGGLGVLAVHS